MNEVMKLLNILKIAAFISLAGIMPLNSIETKNHQQAQDSFNAPLEPDIWKDINKQLNHQQPQDSFNAQIEPDIKRGIDAFNALIGPDIRKEMDASAAHIYRQVDVANKLQCLNDVYWSKVSPEAKARIKNNGRYSYLVSNSALMDVDGQDLLMGGELADILGEGDALPEIKRMIDAMPKGGLRLIYCKELASCRRKLDELRMLGRMTREQAEWDIADWQREEARKKEEEARNKQIAEKIKNDTKSKPDTGNSWLNWSFIAFCFLPAAPILVLLLANFFIKKNIYNNSDEVKDDEKEQETKQPPKEALPQKKQECKRYLENTAKENIEIINQEATNTWTKTATPEPIIERKGGRLILTMCLAVLFISFYSVWGEDILHASFPVKKGESSDNIRTIATTIGVITTVYYGLSIIIARIIAKKIVRKYNKPLITLAFASAVFLLVILLSAHKTLLDRKEREAMPPSGSYFEAIRRPANPTKKELL